MEITPKTHKLLLFDGNAILHRAYHAFPLTFKTQKGELTNAVYGFTSTLLTVFKKMAPTNVVVAFDEKGRTFRHEQFKGYKASRPKMDDTLVCQLARMREVVEALNIPHFGVVGFEADDVLGTLAVQAERQGFDEVVIVTGDRDALQLITTRTHVYFPSRGKQSEQLYDRDSFYSHYGFEPKQLIDFKALAGDSSDEIPGVTGVGPKTAKELIVQFGTVEAIYDHLNELPQAIKTKLESDKEMAFLSKQLATIRTDVPLVFDDRKSRLDDYDKEKAIALFTELEFRSLINRLPDDGWETLVKETISETENSTKKLEEKTAENQMKLF